MSLTEARIHSAKLNRTRGDYAQYLLVGGLIAPLVYVVTTVLGGLLRPGYSHLAQPISELTAAGAPNKTLLEPLYSLYGLLMLLFALGVMRAIGHVARGRAGRLGRVGAGLLITSSVFSLTFFFFPQDPGGTPVTFTGTVHIILAGVVALAFLLAILLLGLAARKTPSLPGYGIFSVVAFAIVLVSGGLTPIALSTELSSYFGLIQRVNIGTLLVWTFVTAWTLLSAHAEAAVTGVLMPRATMGLGQPMMKQRRTTQ